MKTKKIIHEVSNTLAINPLEPTDLPSYKATGLPFGLVIMSIGLSLISQAVSAGTEHIHPYYRYIPYQGPSNTTGTGSQQQPKASGGAGDSEAKKTNKEEQTTSPGGKAETAAPTAGTPSEQVKQTHPAEQKNGEANGAATANKSEEKTSSGESKVGSETSPAAAGTVGQESKPLAPAAATGSPNTPQSPLAKETKAEGSTTGEQKISPVKKSEKDSGEFPSGKLPSFAQVDVNGDHYITKDELQNFPELLQVFDKIDAGKDGKLEQHEYQNLEMETIREGEVL